MRASIYNKIISNFSFIERGYFIKVVLEGGNNSYTWEAYGYLKALMLYSGYFTEEEINYFIEVSIDSIYR